MRNRVERRAIKFCFDEKTDLISRSESDVNLSQDRRFGEIKTSISIECRNENENVFQNDSLQKNQIESDWLIGQKILTDATNDVFSLTEQISTETRTKENKQNLRDAFHSDEIERIQNLTQQIIEKPNRNCFDQVYRSTKEVEK